MRLQGLDELPRLLQGRGERGGVAEGPATCSRAAGRAWPDEYRPGRRTGAYADPEALRDLHLQREARADRRTATPASAFHATPALQPPDVQRPVAHDGPLFASRSTRSRTPSHKPRFRSISMLCEQPHHARSVRARTTCEINKEDAAELGIEDGDTVRAVTPARRRHRGRGHGPRRPGEGRVQRVVRIRAQQLRRAGHRDRRRRWPRATRPSPPARASRPMLDPHRVDGRRASRIICRQRRRRAPGAAAACIKIEKA